MSKTINHSVYLDGRLMSNKSMNEPIDALQPGILEPSLRVTWASKLMSVCKQLRIPSQWQIDQLMRQQISEALKSEEHSTAKNIAKKLV